MAGNRPFSGIVGSKEQHKVVFEGAKRGRWVVICNDAYADNHPDAGRRAAVLCSDGQIAYGYTVGPDYIPPDVPTSITCWEGELVQVVMVTPGYVLQDVWGQPVAMSDEWLKRYDSIMEIKHAGQTLRLGLSSTQLRNMAPDLRGASRQLMRPSNRGSGAPDLSPPDGPCVILIRKIP